MSVAEIVPLAEGKLLGNTAEVTEPSVVQMRIVSPQTA